MATDYNKSFRRVKRKTFRVNHTESCNAGLMFRGDRLTALMAQKGLSQSALAKRVGVSQASIWKLANEPMQGSKHIHVIARELETTPAYLMGEVEDPSEGFMPAPTAAMIADELGIVGLRELDLSLGMGATYLDVPITETLRYFDKDWLRKYTRAAPENLIFADGMGDSMQPTIHDSDLLLIDCSQKAITLTDKIWAIAYANCGAVKRLRPRADGGVEMISDNPALPTTTAYDGELHVLGRVVAIVRKM